MSVQYKVTKTIGSNFWKWEQGKEKVFRVDSAIYVGRAMRTNSGIKEPPDLMDVTDVETGRQYSLLVHTVLKSNLTEAYPDETYVGKFFSATQHAKEEGKRYCGFTVNEVEVDPADIPEAPVAAARAQSPAPAAKKAKK